MQCVRPVGQTQDRFRPQTISPRREELSVWYKPPSVDKQTQTAIAQDELYGASPYLARRHDIKIKICEAAIFFISTDVDRCSNDTRRMHRLFRSAKLGIRAAFFVLSYANTRTI